MYPRRFYQGGWSRPTRRTRTGSTWKRDLASAVMFWIALMVACLVVTGSYEFVKHMVYVLTHFMPVG